MNLIEAWKVAKDGQMIINKMDSSSFIEKKSEGFFAVSAENFISDRWEIVKENKKVVIEKVYFYKPLYGSIIPSGPNLGTILREMKTEGPITMTLEWEE